MHRAPRASTPMTTLRMELPVGRRMPPPSRLPGMDLDAAEPSGRRPGGLVQRLAQVIFRR
jgi:hypothetical protein